MPDIIGTQPQPRLHTRTIAGAAGAPAAGKTGYLYRLRHDQRGRRHATCPARPTLKLDVGPTAKFEYFKNGANADVFVVEHGLRPAPSGWRRRSGSAAVVTVTFRKRMLRTAPAPSGGESSMFFELTSDHSRLQGHRRIAVSEIRSAVISPTHATASWSASAGRTAATYDPALH